VAKGDMTELHLDIKTPFRALTENMTMHCI